MSLKDKAKKIDFGALPSASPEMVESSLPRPKTAPGMMMSRAADQRSDITRENNELKDKVASLKRQRLGRLSSRMSWRLGAMPRRHDCLIPKP